MPSASVIVSSDTGFCLMPEANTASTQGKGGSKGAGPQKEGNGSTSEAELQRRREAAQSVFAALFKAQEAAAAAAQASGAAACTVLARFINIALTGVRFTVQAMA